MTDEIRTKIVNMHNYRSSTWSLWSPGPPSVNHESREFWSLRSRLAQGLVPNAWTSRNAPPGTNIYQLKYSMDLEYGAQNFADSCLNDGSSTTTNNFGQNFVMVSSSVATTYEAIIDAVKSFWREIKRIGVNGDMMFTEHLSYRQPAPLNFTQKYSMDLEYGAQNFADTCLNDGSSSTTNNFGQNFVMVSSSVATTYEAIIDAVKSFWREIKRIGVNGDMMFTEHLSYRQPAPLNFTQ
ncbi:hypothetical protein OSTOST_11467, partial [Ostertagia ostertagi]